MRPDAFVRVVREASDEELAAGLAANRELILPELFRQMPDYLDAAAAGELDAVVEWRVGDRPDGGHDRWQVTIRGGGATIARDGDAEPRVVYTVGAVDFLRLSSGQLEGPQLFLTGRLRVDGDLFLAAQMPALFRLPAS
jgi:hypothetical protein